MKIYSNIENGFNIQYNYMLIRSTIKHLKCKHVLLKITFISNNLFGLWVNRGVSVDKEFACNTGDLGSIPESVRSPGEGHGTHCSVLAWRFPRTEEPGGLQSIGSRSRSH